MSDTENQQAITTGAPRDTPEQLQHMIDGRDQTINELYAQTTALSELLADTHLDRRRIIEDAKEVEHTSDQHYERIRQLESELAHLAADASRIAAQGADAERRAFELGQERDYLREHGPAIEGARASMHLLAKAIGQPELAERQRPQHARIARIARERIKQLEAEQVVAGEIAAERDELHQRIQELENQATIRPIARFETFPEQWIRDVRAALEAAGYINTAGREAELVRHLHAAQTNAGRRCGELEDIARHQLERITELERALDDRPTKAELNEANERAGIYADRITRASTELEQTTQPGTPARRALDILETGTAR